MKKALLPLMIASILPTAAFADVVVYGKASLAFEYTDLKNYTPGVSGGYTDVRNNESRLGVKGSEAINDDLKAIYQYELKIFADDGSTITQRNTFVGLQGEFGTAKIGYFDTPLKLAQEKTDVFKDMIGDWKNVFNGETRSKNIIQYSTPVFFHSLTGNIAYVSSEQDFNNAVKSGYSASVVYDTKMVYVALANDHNIDLANANTSLTAAPSSPQLNVNIARLVGRLTLGPVVLGAMYETYDNGVRNVKGDIKKDGVMLSGIYNFDDQWAAKAQYGSSDMKLIGGKTASVGVDYKMSKSTKVTGYFTSLKDDNAVVNNRHDDKWVGVAMDYTF